MNRTRRILREYGYQAKKSKGQHFLVHEKVLSNIVDAARITPEETVVEIGPGPGNMTRRLVKQAKRVVAIELEHELATVLRAEVEADNLDIIESDVLDVDFAELAAKDEKLKVVANLPYNITTPVLFKLLDDWQSFSSLYLLIQKEVADRICAPPGKKPYGILAVQTQIKAAPRLVMEVGAEAFSPKPRVKSSLVEIKMLGSTRAPLDDPGLFREVVRAAFSQRRKMIKNSFPKELEGVRKEAIIEAMEESGIDPTARPEQVTVEEYAGLSNAILKRKGNA